MRFSVPYVVVLAWHSYSYITRATRTFLNINTLKSTLKHQQIRLLSITDLNTAQMSFRSDFLMFLVWNDPIGLRTLMKQVCGTTKRRTELLSGHILSHEEWTNIAFHPQITIANMKECEENFDCDWYQKSDPPTIKVLPKSIFRHAIPLETLNTYDDLIFLSVQMVKGTLNESFELGHFPFDSQRLHIYLKPREDWKSVMLRSFEIPFENVDTGLNNDQDRKSCKVKNCCLKAPGSGEVVTVVLKDSRRGVRYVRAVVRGVRARSARLLITSLKYLRTTLYHSRDREHFNQKYNTRTPTLEHRYKMHLQYTEKFKSKSGNALNPYVVFETDTRFKKTNTPTPTGTYRTCSKKRLSLHGKRPETRISKSHFAMGCTNVS